MRNSALSQRMLLINKEMVEDPGGNVLYAPSQQRAADKLAKMSYLPIGVQCPSWTNVGGILAKHHSHVALGLLPVVL